jgi:hypothetical protein
VKLPQNKLFWFILTTILFMEIPMTCVPQIVRMFQTGSSRDVSIMAWLSASFFSLLWVMLGLKDMNRLRIWASVLFMVSEFIVATFAIILRVLK